MYLSLTNETYLRHYFMVQLILYSRWLILKERLYISLRFLIHQISKQDKPKFISRAMGILFGKLFLTLGESHAFWVLRHSVFLFYKYQFFLIIKRKLRVLKEHTYLIGLWTRNVWVELESFKIFAVFSDKRSIEIKTKNLILSI